MAGGQLQCAKIRMNCTNPEKYLCANCDIPSILSMDILGRVAQVGDRKIILSLCCASLIYYKGTGHELNVTCGPQCARENQFAKGRSVVNQEPSSSKKANACFVCQQRNVVLSFELLHVPSRTMRYYFLCSKHNLSTAIIASIGDEYDLLKALKLNKKL